MRESQQQPQGEQPKPKMPVKGADWHPLTYKVEMPPYWPNTGFFPSERDMENIANTLEAYEPRHVACVLLRLALEGGVSKMSQDDRDVIENLIGMFIYLDGLPCGWVPEKK